MLNSIRESKPLEAWECRQARTHRKEVISGCMIQATSAETISHAVFLSIGLDNGSNCKARTISFPNGKTLGGQVAQGLYEITPQKNLPR
jgi:hypothetical protein